LFKADSTSFLKFYGLPIGDENMSSIRTDAKGNAYSVPSKPFNGIWNVHNSIGNNTNAQTGSAIHTSGTIRSDSSLMTSTSVGLRLGFNYDKIAASTLGSNINITNMGVNGVGYPQAFNQINGLRNIIVSAESAKTNMGGVLNGNDNTLFHTAFGNTATYTGNWNDLYKYTYSTLTSGSFNSFHGRYSGKDVTTGSYNLDWTNEIDYNGGSPSLGNTIGRILIGTPYDFNGGEVVSDGEVVIASRTRGQRIYNFGPKGGLTTTKVVWRAGYGAGTNQTGLPLYIFGQNGTGTGISGSIYMGTYNAGSTGTAKNTTENIEIGIHRDSVQFDAKAKFNQSVSLPYVAKTATYVITTSDHTIDCTSGTFTTTLPAAATVAGGIFTIKNSGAGVITVACNGAETIDGAATYPLATQYKYVTVQSTGTNWIVMANN
jgi:hypothetical protein